MAFLDQLNALLGGQSALAPQAQQASGGMTNYGAAPTATGPAGSPTATVLARLTPNVRSMAAGMGLGGEHAARGSNPTGVTQPLGGGNLATAISGLSAVDPTASKFGAFAQGLAGGLGAREKALAANASLGVEQQKAQTEALKTLLGANIQDRQENLAEAQAARRIKAMDAVSSLMSGQQPSANAAPAAAQPDATAPSSSAPAAVAAAPTPAPSAPTPSPPPAAGGPPSPGPGPAPTLAPPPIGAPQPSAPPPAAPPAMPPATAASAPRLDPESDPHFLEQRALMNDHAAMLSAGFDPEGATRYANAANQIRQKAQQIRATGLATGVDGRTMVLPGYTEAQSQIATAKAEAEAAGKASQEPLSSPSGAKYRPPAPGYKSSPIADAPLDPPPGSTIGGTPPAMKIDPKTAAIQTSIPAAPRGGGFPIPDIPAGARLVDPGDTAKEQAKTDATNFSNLTSSLPTIEEGIQRYQSLANSFKMFETGSGQDKLTAAAAMAQTYGHPDLAKAILGGDPAASQAATKEAVNLTLATLKSAQPRFAQSEFTAVSSKGTPNPDFLPGTNHQLIAEGLGTMLKNKAFINDWQQANRAGWQSPSAFYTEWSKANPLSGFVASAAHQIGNFKGMDVPGPDQWKEGVTYVVPKDLSPAKAAAFQKRGLAPGAMFRYQPGSAQPLQPVGQGGLSQVPGG